MSATNFHPAEISTLINPSKPKPLNRTTMKRNLVRIITLLSLCLLASGARAFVVYQDNFNYNNGGIIDESGGNWVPGYGNSDSQQIVINGGQVIIPGTSTTDQPRVYFTNGPSYISLMNYTNSGTVYISNSTAAYFPSNSPLAAVYASFTLMVPSSAGFGNTYFAFFTDTNYDYRCRLSIVTNGATVGNYRIAVGNFSTPSPGTNIVQADLVPGNTYTIAMRYLLNSGISTVWVNPTSESTNNPAVSATGTGNISIGGASGNSTCAFGLRNAQGLTNVTLSALIIGTTFADVVPSSVGSNPPFIVQQPQDDISAIIGDNVTFSTLAVGDQPVGYQWYFVSNNVTTAISGATGSNLVLNAVSTNATGYYYAVITNDASPAATTRQAQLIVYVNPVAVAFTTEPQNVTVNVGDTATLSVVATGVPPPTYQWYYITNSSTGLKTNPIAGAAFSTLTLTNLNINNIFTNIFVTAANRVNSTNTAPVTLTVTPIQLVNISQLRAMVDGNYNPTNTTSVFAIQGTVTTWTNMTGTANTEFYMQDSTAGMCVFWSGANSTNRPPAGAIVKVTGPMSSFDGLLEIEPVFSNPLHSVKVISTNNPLPTPQPLPFDPNVTVAQLKAMESTYFVASNVTLAAGTSFSSGINEPITANTSGVHTAPMYGLTFTNQQGQQFTMFINADTDIPGKPKPFGPVTIYGVLGYFSGVGFEFTPSRYADVVSYIHVTNVLSHLTRSGDAPTNTYLEDFLLPGGTQTSYVTVSDPAGGSVTLTPNITGLPASAYWSNVANGDNATAIFHFTPEMADSGSNYVVNLEVASSAGTDFNVPITVYVPTTNEQGVSISEILANPTTNSSAPNFNPLKRATDTVGISTNDQYVEIVNESPVNLLSGWTLDNGNLLNLLFDSKVGLGTTVQSSNSMTIYGGNGTANPGIAVPVTVSPNGLNLPTAGNGLLVLRNNSHYIIDRVVYTPGNLNTNGSLKRFPTFNDAFVPLPYVGTNATAPGMQYDGSAWTQLPQIPTAVTGIKTVQSGTNILLNFASTPNQVSTLWSAGSVSGPYTVFYGQQFLNTTGSFTNRNSAPQQFYYITTQKNN